MKGHGQVLPHHAAKQNLKTVKESERQGLNEAKQEARWQPDTPAQPLSLSVCVHYMLYTHTQACQTEGVDVCIYIHVKSKH